MDTIARLQDWYLQNCDGDWEHQNGVKIDTIDNPGWSVAIDLKDTNLEGQVMANQRVETGEDDWVHVWLEGTTFRGAGDPRKLQYILTCFLDWSAGHQTPAEGKEL